MASTGTYPLPIPNEIYPMRSSSSEGPRLEVCRLNYQPGSWHRRHHEASRVRVLRQTDRLSGQPSHHLNQQANRTLPEARADKLVRYRPRFLADPQGIMAGDNATDREFSRSSPFAVPSLHSLAMRVH
ncbi:hypothetical protein AUP68_04009 [Ilyonectria robusta]